MESSAAASHAAQRAAETPCRTARNGSACVPRPSDASVASVSRYFYERDATAPRFPGTPHLGPHRRGRATARAAARSETLNRGSTDWNACRTSRSSTAKSATGNCFKDRHLSAIGESRCCGVRVVYHAQPVSSWVASSGTNAAGRRPLPTPRFRQSRRPGVVGGTSVQA